jgi:hypothetical protein
MSAKLKAPRNLLAALICSSALLGGVPAYVSAQTNSGFDLCWGDNCPKSRLTYALQYGTPNHMSDTWRLALKRQEYAMSKIIITIPDYFDGQFNEKNIALRQAPKSRIFNLKKGEAIELYEVKVDNDNGVIELTPSAPIPAGLKVEVVLKNVQNPRSGGMYYFNCKVLAAGDVPLPRDMGTWNVSIFRS